MPDDRLLHRCQGHSAKLAQCDHLTFRVWGQYLLSADDFGVMPDAAALIRGDNFALMREAEDEIRRCLDLLVSLRLCERFEHQGQSYLCSLKWQEYQKVSYPRASYYPDPSPEVFEKLSAKTRLLFRKKKKAKGGDGHRLTANGKRLKAKGSQEGEPGEGAAALDPKAIGCLWNEAVRGTDLPVVEDVTGTRRKHAAARLSEHPDREWWVAYFARIVASNFLCGRTPRKEGHEDWRPSFDWAVSPTNLSKVQGGNYDNRKGPEAFSASELKQADETLSRVYGGRCPHGEPPCETREECKRNIIRHRREVA